MSLVDGHVVVLDIAGMQARLACARPDALARLLALGFAADGPHLVRPVSDLADRQRLVGALIAMDALFAGGHGWSPAALVELYREQGVVHSGYRVIVWTSPAHYTIRALTGDGPPPRPGPYS